MAYHLHWPLAELLALEHPDRRAWAAQVAAVNRRLNDQAAAAEGARGRPF